MTYGCPNISKKTTRKNVLNFYNLDDQFEDGIERSTFEHAIDHVITKRFGWSQTVADVVKNKYTDWTKTNDPIENRNQYVHVRFKIYKCD